MEGLLVGLICDLEKNWTPLVQEGESLIITNMAIRLQVGSTGSKVANNWRLERKLKTLSTILMVNLAIIFQHVRIKSNKLANYIANRKVTQNYAIHYSCWDNNIEPDDMENLKQIAIQDHNISDAGAHESEGGCCRGERACAIVGVIPSPTCLHA